MVPALVHARAAATTAADTCRRAAADVSAARATSDLARRLAGRASPRRRRRDARVGARLVRLTDRELHGVSRRRTEARSDRKALAGVRRRADRSPREGAKRPKRSARRRAPARAVAGGSLSLVRLTSGAPWSSSLVHAPPLALPRLRSLSH